jgi:hypothetical protein
LERTDYEDVATGATGDVATGAATGDLAAGATAAGAAATKLKRY